LVLNVTFNNISVIAHNIMVSFIAVAIMLYVVTHILLTVALNSNKAGHHVIRINKILLKVALNTNENDHNVIRYIIAV
jgi:hypothetical protein